MLEIDEDSKIPCVEVPTRASIEQQKRAASHFVPSIPLQCVRAVHQAAGKCVAVPTLYLIIWRESRMQDKRSGIRLSRAATGAVGITPQARSRALTRLQDAGLISVERHPGRKTKVTLKTPWIK